MQVWRLSRTKSGDQLACSCSHAATGLIHSNGRQDGIGIILNKNLNTPAPNLTFGGDLTGSYGCSA